ncbi:MAG: daptomycin-sensing surface protein LiaX [Tetragenococcus sp.]|nr:daptomycin-sensing surface protein LiaX [Tetragenococcus sp.]
MNERQRIMDLVKKGVLSTDEALDLLEEAAKEKDEAQIQKEGAKLNAQKQAEQQTDTEETFEQATKEKNEENKKHLEDILDELATNANKASAELDEVNAEIKGIKEEIEEKREKLMQIDTQEELDEVNAEGQTRREELRDEISDLQNSLNELTSERSRLEEKLKTIRKDQWNQTKEKWNEKIDLPDDWKEQAGETWNQFGGKMAEAGNHLGDFLKKTFDNVSDTVNENVEWKDINLHVPGVSTTKFEKTFEFPQTGASILDIKVANGSMTFNMWDEPDIRIDAKIKLYGKMDAATPEEAFEQRSQIIEDEEHLSFQVPNKRIRCDLVFNLPRRIYDHISVKSLNGAININELDVKDIYLKTTNGQIDIDSINATMLEIEGVHGAINVAKGSIIDSVIETVNGNVTMSATPQNIGISIVNGDIRLTMSETKVNRLDAHSVNGNIKVAFPPQLGLEATAKTSLGTINSRLTDYEVVRQKDERTNQLLHLRRKQEDIAQVDLSTTTGNIYLKDSDK